MIQKNSPQIEINYLMKLNQMLYLLGVGIVDEKTIDKINIQKATYRAMQIAVENLSLEPDVLLVDGFRVDIKNYKQESIRPRAIANHLV